MRKHVIHIPGPPPWSPRSVQGGGFCVPRVPGFDCETRCQNEPGLCSSLGYAETVDSAEVMPNIGSEDALINPAFHDWDKVRQHNKHVRQQSVSQTFLLY